MYFWMENTVAVCRFDWMLPTLAYTSLKWASSQSTFIYTSPCMYVSMYVGMYVCLYVCMYVCILDISYIKYIHVYIYLILQNTWIQTRPLSCALVATSSPMCKYPVLPEWPTLNPCRTFCVISEMQQKGCQAVYEARVEQSLVPVSKASGEEGGL